MIEIIAYRPTWPDEFSKVAGELRHVLGPIALRIDHIGSTAVPGLAAKNVIDIQITVGALRQEIVENLTAAGFSQVPGKVDHVPPGSIAEAADWTKWLFRERANERRTHIHVREEGRANQRYALLFRDYLRSHRDAAEAYGRVKQALARLHPDDSDAYQAVKDPVCDLIVVSAESWASSVRWHAGVENS